MLKISSEEARKKLSLEGRIVKVDPEWKLWYQKENVVSITYELINKGVLPNNTFAIMKY